MFSYVNVFLQIVWFIAWYTRECRWCYFILAPSAVFACVDMMQADMLIYAIVTINPSPVKISLYNIRSYDKRKHRASQLRKKEIISNNISSSSRADPLSPPIFIVHRFRRVFLAVSCIVTELLNIGSSWSSLPLLVHVKGSTGVYSLWVCPYFFSSFPYIQFV